MASTHNLIETGQRCPDFALPREGGGDAVRFYGVAGGRPTVVVLAGDEGAAAVELGARLRDDVAVHVVARSGEGASAEAFRDPDGAVHRAFGVDRPVAVVLDPNLRTTAVVPIGDADAAEAVVAAVSDLPSEHDPAARPAPVLFVREALSHAWREALIERFHAEGSVETGVETVVDGKRAEVTDIRRKRRRDHVVTDQGLLRELTQHIGSRVFPELRKAFAFQAGGFEGFKIGCYTAEESGYFEAHRDNLSTGTAHRRFGLTLNLNDDYEGGELRFPEYGAARYRPDAGEALLFSGSHLHEVLPVERGERFVLLSFVLARRGA